MQRTSRTLREMVGEELRERLQHEGVVLLRSVFSLEPLIRLRDAVTRCFEAIEAGTTVPQPYRYIPHANSVQLTALLDFGVESEAVLLAPLSADGLSEMFSQLIGGAWRCRLEHSWVRKKFAPRNAPKAGYHMQDWHQDGALGAQFPLQPGKAIPPTNLVTCWIPLGPCGKHSPSLEFLRKPQPSLLHFTELHDAVLRQRFDTGAFWAPELAFGDGLVFRNDILHRTHVTQWMHADRISVEYRVFPAES